MTTTATTTTDLSSLSELPCPPFINNIDLNEDLKCDNYEAAFSPKHQTSSSSSSSQDQGGTPPPFQYQQEGDDCVPHGGGSSWKLSTTRHESSTLLKFSIKTSKKEDASDDNLSHREKGSGNNMWMSSKMRLMRKMMNSDEKFTSMEEPMQNDADHEKHPFSISESNIRVCADCNTTKTPLWRSGPRGPKSLCNACGIRQRKARRALALAAVENGTISCTPKCKLQPPKNKKSTNGCDVRCKKRNKSSAAAAAAAAPTSHNERKLWLEDLAVSLSENSALYHQQVFPQDEKEAAILLMALSCGLVHG